MFTNSNYSKLLKKRNRLFLKLLTTLWKMLCFEFSVIMVKFVDNLFSNDIYNPTKLTGYNDFKMTYEVQTGKYIFENRKNKSCSFSDLCFFILTFRFAPVVQKTNYLYILYCVVC